MELVPAIINCTEWTLGSVKGRSALPSKGVPDVFNMVQTHIHGIQQISNELKADPDLDRKVHLSLGRY
ncbi:cleavage and polyadenylation specific protein [Moniliophthora roreri]|nr:cleavage and polyadenylation specific protein [Moniliophthora roreri]